MNNLAHYFQIQLGNLLHGLWWVIFLKALRPWRPVLGVIEGRLRSVAVLFGFGRVIGDFRQHPAAFETAIVPMNRSD